MTRDQAYGPGRVGRVEVDVAGRRITFETGHLAKQANGAVVVRSGDTVVLVTATMSATPREGIDFFPLTCDYEEKMFAAGKIPGGFFKREGRPGERATLTARLMDRPIRPLFPKGFRHDVQVIATVLSTDQENTPDILAMTGAGAADAPPVRASDTPASPTPGIAMLRRFRFEFRFACAIVEPSCTSWSVCLSLIADNSLDEFEP